MVWISDCSTVCCWLGNPEYMLSSMTLKSSVKSLFLWCVIVRISARCQTTNMRLCLLQFLLIHIYFFVCYQENAYMADKITEVLTTRQWHSTVILWNGGSTIFYYRLSNYNSISNCLICFLCLFSIKLIMFHFYTTHSHGFEMGIHFFSEERCLLVTVQLSVINSSKCSYLIR